MTGSDGGGDGVEDGADSGDSVDAADGGDAVGRGDAVEGPARMGSARMGSAFTVPGRPDPVPLEVADSARARHRGLLGRDGIDGALLLGPASSVHTLGMRFAIDVAYLDRALRVLAVRTMRPGRVGAPRPRARYVLEAEAGRMAAWGVRRGVRIGVLPPPGKQ